MSIGPFQFSFFGFQLPALGFGRAILLIFGMAILVGCQPGSPEVVKIGLVAPFEGENRDIGYDGIYAARLAIREFNESQQAGNSDIRVALVALDDSGNGDIAAGNAQALAADPAIIAVVGMGSEATRLIGAENFARSGISFLHTGVIPFEPVPPESLPKDFAERYAAVTPFDEEAGPEAASVYDAFDLIFAGIDQIKANNQKITAENMAEILKSVKITGITGRSISLNPE